MSAAANTKPTPHNAMTATMAASWVSAPSSMLIGYKNISRLSRPNTVQNLALERFLVLLHPFSEARLATTSCSYYCPLLKR
jgi:hypothetical protein